MKGETEWLQRLHDIHEPPLPPAPSTALLVLSVLLIIASLGLLVWRWWWYRRRPLRRLRQAVNDTRALPTAQALEALARLVRRRMLPHPAAGTGHLSGLQWCHSLNHALGTDFFTRGPGRLLGQALYGRTLPAESDVQALREGLPPILRRHPRRRRS